VILLTIVSELCLTSLPMYTNGRSSMLKVTLSSFIPHHFI